MLESGIQDPDGGVARYYLASEGRNLPVSTEITGYAASAFAFLYEETGDGNYLEAGVRAARFLTDAAWDRSLRTFPFELAPGSPCYFFDCGIIVRGLLAVWRHTRDQNLLDVAVSAGRSMGRDFFDHDVIHPVIALPSRQPLPYEKRWSREPGCFLLKSALAWRNLATLTADPMFSEWWRRALDFAVDNDPHFLPGTMERERVMDRLHAYCYYLEALLATEEDKLLRAGIERCTSYLREISPDFTRSDVNAQLLRVRLLADKLGLVPIDIVSAQEEARAVLAFQYRQPDPRLRGGFCFGRRKGAALPFANPVSTAFCAQAYQWWLEYGGQTLNATLDQLI